MDLSNSERCTLAVIVALVLGFFFATHVEEETERLWVRATLASNDWTPVEKKLEELRERAFCFSLTTQYTSAKIAVAHHNDLAEEYNTVAQRASRNLKSAIEFRVVTPSEALQIASMTQTDPWIDCWQRHQIFVGRPSSTL